MGLFNRKRDDEQPPVDAGDPMAALQRAQEALSNTKFATGESGGLEALSPEVRDQIAGALAKAQAAGAQWGAAPQFGQPPVAADPISQVERLVKLRDADALTQGEFEEQKRKVLGEG